MVLVLNFIKCVIVKCVLSLSPPAELTRTIFIGNTLRDGKIKYLNIAEYPMKGGGISSCSLSGFCRGRSHLTHLVFLDLLGYKSVKQLGSLSKCLICNQPPGLMIDYLDVNTNNPWYYEDWTETKCLLCSVHSG